MAAARTRVMTVEEILAGADAHLYRRFPWMRRALSSGRVTESVAASRPQVFAAGFDTGCPGPLGGTIVTAATEASSVLTG